MYRFLFLLLSMSISFSSFSSENPPPVNLQAKKPGIGGWELSYFGAGEWIFQAQDDEKGQDHRVLGIIDIWAVKQIDEQNSCTIATRILTDAAIYDEPWCIDGFGDNDCVPKADFIHKLEAMCAHKTRDGLHEFEIKGGKGFAAFGFDVNEEFGSFGQLPLITHLSNMGGLGEVTHVTFSYVNRLTPGHELSFELSTFSPRSVDGNPWDIELPEEFPTSWSIRIKDSFEWLNTNFTLMGSVAEMKSIDAIKGLDGERRAIGIKFSKSIRDMIWSGLAEYISGSVDLNGAPIRESDGAVFQTSLQHGANTYSARYSLIESSLRPQRASIWSLNYTRTLNKNMQVFIEGVRSEGVIAASSVQEVENIFGNQNKAVEDDYGLYMGFKLFFGN